MREADKLIDRMAQAVFRIETNFVVYQRHPDATVRKAIEADLENLKDVKRSLENLSAFESEYRQP